MDEISYLGALGRNITFYVSGIFYTSGIVLNVFSALVFFSCKRLNRTSMGFLYGALSIADALSLSCSVFLAQFVPVLNPAFNFSLLSDTTCKLFFFFVRLTAFTASWLQMYISLDRWISVRFPRRFKTLRSPRTLSFIVLILVTLMGIVASENFLYSLIPNTKTTTTTLYNQTVNGSTNATVTITTTTTSFGCSGTYQLLFAAQIISAAMRTWIPLIFLVFINLLTIRILVQSRRRVTSQSDKTPYSSKERQFTMTVLALNGIFFVLNVPFSVYWVLSSIYSFSTSVSPLFLAYLGLANSITLSMAYFYQAINFYINIAFNSLFRREVRHLIYRIVRKPLSVSSVGRMEPTNSISLRRNDLKSTLDSQY